MRTNNYRMGDALRQMVEREAFSLFKKIQDKPNGTEIIGTYVWVKKVFENAYKWEVI